jgi:hypothetical protein
MTCAMTVAGSMMREAKKSDREREEKLMQA